VKKFRSIIYNIPVDRVLHRNIYLSGFRCAGKTTIGPLLADLIGYEFVDLEKGIEKLEGCPMTRLEMDIGEHLISRLERSFLQKHFQDGGAVVALNHATVVNPEMLESLSRTGTLITLQAPLEVILSRLERRQEEYEGTLYQPGEPPEEGIGRLLFNRRFYYRRADAVLPTHPILPETVARFALSVVLAMQAESQMVS
jgi:shikimate kinase